MSRLSILLNLAASLFLAPLPALVVLAYHHAPAAVPLQDGFVAVASGFIVYWVAVLLLLRVRRRRSGHAPRLVDENGLERDDPLVLDRRIDAALDLAGGSQRRRPDHSASFEDVPDPIGDRDGRDSGELLIDRVADVSQIKRFAENNRVELLTAWHRNVRESVRGDRVYGNWAFEVDRILLSAAFMTRTLDRAETIAVLTAEVGAMVEEKVGNSERGHGAIEAPRGPGQAPEPAVSRVASQPSRDRGRQASAQVWTNRVSAMLGCSGWRIGHAPVGEANGIDLFAEHAGKVAALRCVPASAVVDAATVVEAAADAAAFGVDHAAVVAADGNRAVTPDARDAAIAQGVLLLSERDLPALADRLAAFGAGRDTVFAMHPAAE